MKSFPSSMLLLILALPLMAGEAASDRLVEVGNLVYAGTKTSKCFSDAFLKDVAKDAKIATAPAYVVTKAAEPQQLARVGFAVMTGEGAFTLTTPERTALKDWLGKGGFLLASASCSSPEWGASLRREVATMFGSQALIDINANHPVFSTVHDLGSGPLKKHDGTARFLGVLIDGRLSLLFSPEGLNDTGNVPGCCCCGGNEVKNARQVVANALVYSLVE